MRIEDHLHKEYWNEAAGTRKHAMTADFTAAILDVDLMVSQQVERSFSARSRRTRGPGGADIWGSENRSKKVRKA